MLSKDPTLLNDGRLSRLASSLFDMDSAVDQLLMSSAVSV